MTPRAAAAERLRIEAASGEDAEALDAELDRGWRERRLQHIAGNLNSIQNQLDALEKRIAEHGSTPEILRQRAELDTVWRAHFDDYVTLKVKGPDGDAGAFAACVRERRHDLSLLARPLRIEWLIDWAAESDGVDEFSRLRLHVDDDLEAYRATADLIRDLRRRKRLSHSLMSDLIAFVREQWSIPSEHRDALRVKIFDAAKEIEDGTAIQHKRALVAILAALTAALAALRNRADLLWPELRLGRGRPGDVVDIRLRERLRLWGFSDADVAAARDRSSDLKRLLRERTGSAARHARRRSSRL